MSFWKGKRVLVTGGAGFIGSYLVNLLVMGQASVYVVDNLERGRLENLRSCWEQITFIRGDIRDPAMCREVTADKDVVMNLAAKVTGIEYNRHHHGDMFTSNILINTNVLEAARLNEVKRYLAVSTACIYPHDSKVPTPESEGDRGSPEPTNAGYGWAKRMAEQQAIYYAQEYGMEIAIARPFNAYGPRDYFDRASSHVIPALIRKVLDGDDPVVVWGSGNQTRAFVHALDVARGMMLLTEKYAAAEPVNIGHDREVSMRELLALILRLTGEKVNVVFDTSRPEGYPRRAADVTKLRKVTEGFVPSIPLEAGVAQTIEWYRANRITAAGDALATVALRPREGVFAWKK